MGSRQPACDPCRKAKVACDHKLPTCTRCREYERERLCTYRSSPFKKRKRKAGSDQLNFTHTSSSVYQSSPAHTHIERFQTNPIAAQQHSVPEGPPDTLYPNPGHQGPSSHATIFNELRSANVDVHDSIPGTRAWPSSTRSNFNYSVHQAATYLDQLLSLGSLATFKEHIDFWRAKGVNLALAEPLMQPCLDAVAILEEIWTTQRSDSQKLVLHLLENSRRPLRLSCNSTLRDFQAQICGTHVRLETLGILLCATVHATDVALFPPLYVSDEARYGLRLLATRLCDVIVALCLELDCLNDLQLILQWEHFHVHSNVSGDQSESDNPASLLCTHYMQASDPGVFLVMLSRLHPLLAITRTLP
jgi:hypothetical protein